MIGADTNILVRAFLEDDPEQAQKAQQFLEETSKDKVLFISSYALLEFAWVLKVKKFKRSEIYDAIITLTDSPGITIGLREIVLVAAERYLKGKADFGDYMILAEGDYNGSHHLTTFDQLILSELNTASLPLLKRK